MLLVHPLVPVTVYRVVLVGLAVTTDPVVALRPVAGDHVYVLAPLAVNVEAFTPEQIVGRLDDTAVVKVAETVTSTV